MGPHHHHLDKHRPSVYRVVVQESLGEGASAWFTGMSVRVVPLMDGGQPTVLTALIADQAALRGFLTAMWNMNLTIVSVSRVESP